MPENYKNAIVKGAHAISDFAGAGDLVEYTGTALASAMAPEENQQYITTDVSTANAYKSAARLAATIGTLSAGGVMGAIYKARKANLATRAAAKAREFPRAFKIPNQAKPVQLKHWMQNTAGHSIN